MITLRFFLTDIAYRIENNKAVVHLYGRTQEGQVVCVHDETFEPYFYVLPRNFAFKDELATLKVSDKGNEYNVIRVEEVTKKVNEQEQNLLKVIVNLPSGVPVLKDAIKGHPAVKECFEYDIKFVRRYLIDKGLQPLTLIEATGKEHAERSRVPVLKAMSVKQVSDDTIKPKILSFDIETYNSGGKVQMDKDPILMIAFWGETYRKVLTWKRFETTDPVEFLPSEADMLQRFKEIVEEYKPDVLAGYYSDGFDLPFILTRAKKYKIPMDFSLDGSEVKVEGRTQTSVQITGIVHVDILKFIRKIIGRSMQTDVFTLDAVAKELLGEGKSVVDLDNLPHAWGENKGLGEYATYNLQDTKLTYNLCEKILPNMIEFVKLIGVPLWDINRMSFSQLVEWYIIKQAAAANEVTLNRPGYQQQMGRMNARFKGALVYEPTPGLYDDIVVFDYRSLYPSIIASHNISPGMLNCACCPNAKKVPFADTEMRFCEKRKGFLSFIIEEIITHRTRIKEMLKKEKDVLLSARSEALKVLANAFYGYLGFAPARWYSFECGQSVTAYGRHYITDVIEQAKKEGYTVLYSDSLPHNRYVFVKDKTGNITLRKIGELYTSFEPGMQTLGFTNDANVKFMPLRRVIRHSLSKSSKLLKFTTKYGTTVVTDKHSVYTYQDGLKLVAAKSLRRGDALISLTGPTTVVRHKEGGIIDLLDLDWGDYRPELRLYADNTLFPANPGKCPYCAKRYASLATHVSAQHQTRKTTFSKTSPFGWIGTRNAKGGRIPRHWTLDRDLAWLIGFYCAEGSVSDVKTKTGRKMLLSFGGQDKQLITKVKQILDRKLGADLQIIKNHDARINKDTYYYRAQRIPLVPLFASGFDAGKGSEFKRVPRFIFTAEESIRKAFVQGYLDGDGAQGIASRYRTKFIRFSTKSKELAVGLQFLLKGLPFEKNAFGKTMKHVAWSYRKDKPKINTLRLQSARNNSHENFCLAEITSVERAPHEKYVYDLEVQGCHNFVDAEGMILVHNTDSIFLLLGTKTKEDAVRFVEHINKSLPGLMELDYEGFYPRALFVSTKASEAGAKKKYALIDKKGVLKIRGFETVRRNTSFIARDVQKEVLRIVLGEGDPQKAAAHVKKIVADLKANKIPLDKVVIWTQLTKDVSEYGNISPHVAAAQRLANRGTPAKAGEMIKYVVMKGIGKIRDRVKLEDEAKQEEYDGDYYVEHQVIPVVEKIFAVLGVSVDELEKKGQQKTLGGF